MRRLPIKDKDGNYNHCPYSSEEHGDMYSSIVYLTSNTCNKCNYFVQKIKNPEHITKYVVCSADEKFDEKNQI
jgi:hypothetical protein